MRFARGRCASTGCCRRSTTSDDRLHGAPRHAARAFHEILTPIRINVALAEAPSVGKTIFEFDGSSRGAVDYALLAEDLKLGLAARDGRQERDGVARRDGSVSLAHVSFTAASRGPKAAMKGYAASRARRET